MGDVDLTEAVEAAARAAWNETGTARGLEHRAIGWDDLDPATQHGIGEAVLASVTAAAPLIEAQVRAQIAADIQSRADDLSSTGELGMEGYVNGLDDAVRIARGDS